MRDEWHPIIAMALSAACVCRYRGPRPRTRAPEGGDGRGQPEIASKAPDLPNPDGMRRMRGRAPGSGSASKLECASVGEMRRCFELALAPSPGGAKDDEFDDP